MESSRKRQSQKSLGLVFFFHARKIVFFCILKNTIKYVQNKMLLVSVQYIVVKFKEL
jgi:hypothetical protein